ncbi:MAG TPA: YigZ family protein [Clostridia bacterium]|nr:YigZ family protein [Clostridia bacterium]
MDRYVTVKNESFCESVISRSRFISQCFPVESEEEALARLAEVRSNYPDASHTCYAYRVGARGETARFSDAGEPSGTAGMPIFEVLRTNEVTYALCAVTRYFGGVLLGTGGLARAYGGGAAEALRLAGRVERVPAILFDLRMDYARFAALEGYLRKAARIDGVDYGADVLARAAVPDGEAEAFAARVTELSFGRVKPERRGEVFVEREF